MAVVPINGPGQMSLLGDQICLSSQYPDTLPLHILGSKASFCRLVMLWSRPSHQGHPSKGPVCHPGWPCSVAGPSSALVGSWVFTGGAAGCCTTGSRVQEDTMSSLLAIGAAVPAAGTDRGDMGRHGVTRRWPARQDHPLSMGPHHPQCVQSSQQAAFCIKSPPKSSYRRGHG